MSGGARYEGKRIARGIRQERGATLLEALGYLTVAALITAGVLALFGPSFTSAQGTRLANEVASLANNVRDVYASRNSYVGVSIGTLAQASAVPPTIKVNGSGSAATATDTWGGAVTLTPGAGGNNAQLQYSAVPSDICRRVLVAGTGWLDITVNNNDLGNVIDLNHAYTACNNAAGNTIVWTFQ